MPRTAEMAAALSDAPLSLSEGQARLMALIARKNDVELESQFVDEQRLYLASLVASLITAIQAAEPGREVHQVVDGRLKQMIAADAQLERIKRRLEEMLVALQADIDDIQGRIADNIHALIPEVDESERLENIVEQELSTIDEELNELLRTAQQISAEDL